MYHDYGICFREECGVTCRKCMSLKELENIWVKARAGSTKPASKTTKKVVITAANFTLR